MKTYLSAVQWDGSNMEEVKNIVTPHLLTVEQDDDRMLSLYDHRDLKLCCAPHQYIVICEDGPQVVNSKNFTSPNFTKVDQQEEKEALNLKLLKEAELEQPGTPVNPPHYKGDLVMRIIERFDLGFCLGNVVKYVLRHQNKNQLEDLKKAQWYLTRHIENLEGQQRELL